VKLRLATAIFLIVAAGCGRDKEPPSPKVVENPAPAPKVQPADPPKSTKPVRRKNGDKIAGWGTVSDPDSDCTILEADGMVSITVPGTLHEINPTKQPHNSPRVLREITGDFRVVVRVTGDFTPVHPSTSGQSVPFSGAGLLAWSDESNLAVVCRNHFVLNQSQHVCFAPLFEVFQNGQPVLGNPPIVPAATFQGDSTALYLERKGNVLKGAYSNDAKTWIGQRETATRLPDAIKIGVVMISTSSKPFTATFDGFKLLDE
jgi:hypothetical protein